MKIIKLSQVELEIARRRLADKSVGCEDLVMGDLVIRGFGKMRLLGVCLILTICVISISSECYYLNYFQH